jgi:hypothetical protein
MKQMETENRKLKEENVRLKLEIQRLRNEKKTNSDITPSLTTFAVMMGLILFGNSGILGSTTATTSLSPTSSHTLFHQHSYHHYFHENARFTSRIFHSSNKGGEEYVIS